MESSTKTQKPRLAAVCLFAAYFLLYLFTSPEKLPEGDEAILLGVADRVAHYGFSWLPPGVNYTEKFSSYGFFADGFSKYGLGQSLIQIPVVEAFRSAKKAASTAEYIVSVLQVYCLAALMGAAINAMFFLVCLRLGRSLGSAFALTLVLGLTTMVWPYAQTLFSDPTLGLMWLAALYGFLSFKATQRGIWLALSGACVGFAVLVKIAAAYTLPIFGAYFIHLVFFDSRDKKGERPGWAGPFIWFGVPLLAMGYATLWYNKLRYGGYFSLGYLDNNTYDSRDTLFGFNVPFLVGLYAQLLSSGKGFFFYNPSTVLAFFGWKESCRRNQAEALLILGIIGGMILMYSKWYGWHGDWCWGLRYLSCLPPFFLLLAGPFMENLFRRWRNRGKGYRQAVALTTALLALSFAVQIPGLCIKSNNYILTAAQADVFKGKFFQADWPIRDDSLQMHFIPEFSPLAGHLWMMRVIYHRDDGQAIDAFRSPPWKSLNSLWIPEKFNPSMFRYNIWWLNARTIGLPGTAHLVYAAYFMLAASLVCFGIGLAAVLKIKDASDCSQTTSL